MTFSAKGRFPYFMNAPVIRDEQDNIKLMIGTYCEVKVPVRDETSTIFIRLQTKKQTCTFVCHGQRRLFYPEELILLMKNQNSTQFLLQKSFYSFYLPCPFFIKRR